LITIRSCSSPPMSFNRQLIQWLIWYNAERPPWSLEVKSPVQFLLKGNPSLCKTWWPNTDCLTYLIPIAYVAQAVFPTENDREDFIGPRLTIRSGMIICLEHSVLAAASSSAVRRSSRHVTAVPEVEFQRPAECCGLFEGGRMPSKTSKHGIFNRSETKKYLVKVGHGYVQSESGPFFLDPAAIGHRAKARRAGMVN
jgi:hypothetical protein